MYGDMVCMESGMAGDTPVPLLAWDGIWELSTCRDGLLGPQPGVTLGWLGQGTWSGCHTGWDDIWGLHLSQSVAVGLGGPGSCDPCFPLPPHHGLPHPTATLGHPSHPLGIVAAARTTQIPLRVSSPWKSGWLWVLQPPCDTAANTGTPGPLLRHYCQTWATKGIPGAASSPLGHCCHAWVLWPPQFPAFVGDWGDLRGLWPHVPHSHQDTQHPWLAVGVA